MKGCIYHFTDKSEKRPIVYQKQLNELRKFAAEYGKVTHEYVDKSLRQCEHTEKQQMIANIDDYDFLVTKDFYHLCRNTMACIDLMKGIGDKGIQIHSIENGSFHLGNAPFDVPLKVGVYHSKFRESNERQIETQMDIFDLYIKDKTKWQVVDKYVDEAKEQTDDAQVELRRLIENSSRYDLIIVKDFGTFHWRTAKFFSRREELKLPIFSLKEGYLDYRR